MNKFQFHDGTITTIVIYTIRALRDLFQFHDGTITTS